MRRSCSVSVLIGILLLLPVWARGGIEVRNYTIRDGLSDSSPRSLVQDSDGVLWIGSWNGVDCFGGSEFKPVRDENGTSFGTVLDLAEAEQGCFWICSNLGIHRLNLRDGSSRSFQIGYERSPQMLEVYAMGVSPEHRFFVSALNWGICYYSPEQDDMVSFNIAGVSTGDIRKIICLGEDKLLLHKGSGRVEAVSYQFDKGTIEAKKTLLPLDGIAFSGLFQIDGGVALVSNDGELWVLDAETLEVSRRVRLPEGSFSAGAGKPGSPLAAVSLRGIQTVEVNLETGQVRKIDALDGKYVSCLLYGMEDILWAGIDSGGLLSVVRREEGMSRIMNRDIFGDKVSKVSSFHEAADGRILVATEGSGLFWLEPDGSVGKRLGKSDGLGSNKVNAMAPGLGDDILIGEEWARVDVLSQGRIRRILSSDERLSNVFAICRDERNDCWYLGIYGTGLVRLRARRAPSGDYIVTDLKDWFTDNPDVFAAKLAMSLLVTEDDRLIVGTLSEGCLIFDLKTEQFLEQRYCEEPVLCLYPDEDGSLWIGTGGRGLLHVRKEASGEEVSEWYGRECGLKDLSIHAILKDKTGKIWASTNAGIFCLDPGDRSVVSFYDMLTLQSNEFSNSSCLAASDGTFLFGGVEGLNRFDPLKLEKRTFEPDILFTSFTLIQDPGRFVPYRDDIVLRHDENYFSIRYSAVEYIENVNCEYAYRLVGFEDNWIYQEKAAPVTYSNLRPGKYRFEVRCTNGDKRWSPRVSSLNITIRYPWWNTWWAYILYACLFAAMAWGINLLVRRRMKRKQEMEMEILRKEHENETYEAKLRFFTNIAHEFGTPLTLISGAGEQLLDDCRLESRPTRYVQIIKDNADRMQRLIKELMDFRKVDTGHYTPVYSRFDVADLVRRIVEGYAAAAEKNGILQELSLPSGPLEIISDYSAVEKIVHNLLSNAYKYTPEGGRIGVGLMAEAPSSVRITVSNSGKGIKPEDLPKVFDRFVVLENLESEAKSGRIVRNGVGLALVHSLVQMLGGSISVSSERKKSTEFLVVLPSAEDRKDALEATPIGASFSLPEEVPGPAEAAPSGMSILIVDDEKPIRDLVSEILSDRYEVLQASNGKEAVELISHGLPDLVITDIAMPEMNGIELCRYLKENEITRNIPIVFLSFLSDIQNEIGSYETGGEAFIPKPFYPRHLTAVVNKILSGRESLKSYYGSVMSNSDLLNEKVVMKGDREFIVKMTGIVESDLSNEALSPAILCDRMHVSKAQLYRKLNELVGMSPVEFIRSIRLEHAARLLKTTDLTVQEIMYEVGFNNKSYFYREFGKVYGLSPRAYRMEALHKDNA